MYCTYEYMFTRFPHYVAGITSWGYDCALPRLPGIYTDVTMYITWIKQKAERLNIYIPYLAT